MNTEASPILRELLERDPRILDSSLVERFIQLKAVILRGNERQNLTRLVSEEDFYFGHLIDAIELVHLNWIEGRPVEIGAGGGLPGLACAIIDKKNWGFLDAEKSKTDFIIDAIREMNLDSQGCRAYWGRIEKVLSKIDSPAETLVARAVGPVGRIWNWTKECSTWNKLILFKGPSWESEWEEFAKLQRDARAQLKIFRKHEYKSRGHHRVLVELHRS